MGATTTTIDAVLKEVYEGELRDILNSRVLAWKEFHKEGRSASWEGRRVRYPINLGRNEGVMATSEGGTLPDAGNQVNVETQIPIRFNHGRIQLTIQAIKHSRSNKGAFKRAMDQEMQGLVRDLGNDLNRQMWGWGKGILAYVNDATPSGSTTVGVDTPGGVAGSTLGNRFLRANMNIAFINPSNGAIRAGGARTISSVSSDGTEMVLNSAPNAAVADNDHIVRAAKSSTTVVGDTSYDKEVMGLLGLVDDGTYLDTLHNISRTSYPIWKSPVISSVGALSADVIQRALDVADQIGEGKVEAFWCHHSVRRAYLTLTEADRRYAGGDLSNPDAGTKAAKMGSVTFGDIPWKVEKFAPFGMLFGLDKSHFTRYSEVEGEWADEDGTILLRLQDTDAYEARYRIFENYENYRPASCVRLDGIDTTVVAAHLD